MKTSNVVFLDERPVFHVREEPGDYDAKQAKQNSVKWPVNDIGNICQVWHHFRKPLPEIRMPTRNVVLTDQQSQLVDEFVREGRYQNASEVLREGLRLLADRRARQDAELDDIRSGVLRGLDQADAGEFAAGTGEEAVRRAFDQAVERQST